MNLEEKRTKRTRKKVSDEKKKGRVRSLELTSIPAFAPNDSLTFAYIRNCPETRPAAEREQRAKVSSHQHQTHPAWRLRLTHDDTRSESSEETLESSLLSERDQPSNHRSLGSMTLVDLREEGIGGVGEDSSGDSSSDSGSESDAPFLGR